MDGGAAAYDVLNDDQDINQEEALARARAIVRDFPAALRRIGLEEEWNAVANGRAYDLEAAEHNLCGCRELCGIQPVSYLKQTQLRRKYRNLISTQGTASCPAVSARRPPRWASTCRPRPVPTP